MTMLPDIDQQSYDIYEQQELERQLAAKQQGFGLDRMMGDKIAGLQSLVGGAASGLGTAVHDRLSPPPEPAAAPAFQEPAPAPEPLPSQVAPESAPAPAPTPQGIPLEQLLQMQVQADTSSLPAPNAPPPTDYGPPPPRARVTPPSPTSVAPSQGTSDRDWMGGVLSAVGQAGGDVRTFAENFQGGAGDKIGGVLSAAHSAGADLQSLAQNLPPPPQPAPQPGPAAQVAQVPGGAALDVGRGGDLRAYARQAAVRSGIDPDIFERQIQQESGFNPSAKSGAGAIGIAQFMPGTAAGMQVDPTDPYAALDAAARLDQQNLQRYGTYDKMLAAYNAGGGAVEKYGGVPPYQETQSYVSKILQGAKDVAGGVVGGAASAVRRGVEDISQFGNPSLTNDEAYAACGPAAAVRFASMYGRNPTLREATDLAKEVGWTSGQGMAGLASEKALMDKIGVPTKMVSGPQWDQFAKEAQSGNPVTISTAGHYFFADGYDPNTGAFHVGRSGQDLKRGSEWMTPAQMTNVMGAVQGGLLADNPQVPSPSIADQDTNPVGWLGRMKDSLTSSIGGAADTVSEAVKPIIDPLAPLREHVSRGGSDLLVGQQRPTPSDSLTDPLGRRYAPAVGGAVLDGQPDASAPTRGGLTGLQALADQIGGGLPDLSDVLQAPPEGSALQKAISAGIGNLNPTEQVQALSEWRQSYQHARDIGTQRLNPARDVPLLGGIINQSTDPESYLAAGLLGKAGKAVEAGLGGGLGARIANQALQGGGFNALVASQQPGATVEDVALAGGEGAVLGGSLPIAGKALGKAGEFARTPEGQALIRSRQRGEGVNPFANLRSDIPEVFDNDGRLNGKPTDFDRAVNLPGLAPELWTQAKRKIPGLGGIRDITGVALGEGEQGAVNPITEATRARMPNLAHIANDLPEVQAMIQRIAEENPDLIDAVKGGRISHAQLIADTAKHLGMTAEDFLKTPMGKAYRPEELLGLRAVAADSTDQLKQLASHIQAKGGAEKLTDAERLFVATKTMDAAQLVIQATKGASTAARTLNQQRINVTKAVSQRIVRGTELTAAKRKLTAARAREAFHNKELGVVPGDEVVLPGREPLPGEPTPRATDAAGRAYDDYIKAARDELKAEGRYTEKNWDDRLNEMIEQAHANSDSARAAAAQRERSKIGKAAYDDYTKAVEAELKAQNNFDQATWDRTLKELEDAKAKGSLYPKDATTPEGQTAWLQGQATVARREAIAENARAVKAWNRKLNEGESDNKIATRILERLGGEKITTDMVSNLVKVMAEDDPMATARYLQGLQKVGWWNRFNTLRYGGMLGATATHLGQLSNNSLNLALATALQPAAAVADMARYGAGKALQKVGVDALAGPRTRYMSETGALKRGAGAGWKTAASDAMEIMRSGLNPTEVGRNWEAATRPGFGSGQIKIGGKSLPEGVAGKVDFAAEHSLRLLAAGDALIRGTAEGAYTSALAERHAIREGLSGNARRERVREIMENIQEFPELLDEAQNAAKRVVSQESRGEIRKLAPSDTLLGRAQSFITPFVRTPGNIVAQGLGYTPLGYLGSAKALGDAASIPLKKAIDAGGWATAGESELQALRSHLQGEGADRAVRATFGTGLMIGAKHLADEGHLTGPTPEDEGERGTLPNGWQPWAVKVPIPGVGNTYIKYANLLGGVGYPLAVAAAWAEAERKQRLGDDTQTLAGRVAGGSARYFMDQTMLRSMSNLYDTLTDPNHKLENFLEGMTTQFAPESALGRQLDRVLGTGPRDPHGVVDAFEATYPGLSGRVQAKLDGLGRPREQTQTGLGALLTTYGVEQEDPILAELRTNDVGLTGAPESMFNLDLSKEEREQFPAQAGGYIYDVVSDLLLDPEYQRLDVRDKQRLLRAVVSSSREKAAGDFFRDLPDDETQARREQYLQRTAPIPGVP